MERHRACVGPVGPERTVSRRVACTHQRLSGCDAGNGKSVAPLSATLEIGGAPPAVATSLLPSWLPAQYERSYTLCMCGCTCSQQAPSASTTAPMCPPSHVPLGSTMSRSSGLLLSGAPATAAASVPVEAELAVGESHAPAEILKRQQRSVADQQISSPMRSWGSSSALACSTLSQRDVPVHGETL